MQSLTIIVLALGVIAVIVSWITAARIITGDDTSSTFVSPSAHRAAARSSELAGAHTD